MNTAMKIDYTSLAEFEPASDLRFSVSTFEAASSCQHRLIVKGVAREHRRLAPIDIRRLLSFAAQCHHVPEVSCASTTRTAAGHLDNRRLTRSGSRRKHASTRPTPEMSAENTAGAGNRRAAFVQRWLLANICRRRTRTGRSSRGCPKWCFG